jgi:hypothetical protein
MAIYKSYRYQRSFFKVFVGSCRIQEGSLKTLAMENESRHNNPHDEVDERFVKMEEQDVDISRNMAFLMVALVNNFGPSGENGDSKLEVGSDNKSRDNEDSKNELKKELEKEKPSSSVITSLQSLFKMEAKVDIKPYQDDIDVVKLNYWLQ